MHPGLAEGPAKDAACTDIANLGQGAASGKGRGRGRTHAGRVQQLALPVGAHFMLQGPRSQCSLHRRGLRGGKGAVVRTGRVAPSDTRRPSARTLGTDWTEAGGQRASRRQRGWVQWDRGWSSGGRIDQQGQKWVGFAHSESEIDCLEYGLGCVKCVRARRRKRRPRTWGLRGKVPLLLIESLAL